MHCQTRQLQRQAFKVDVYLRRGRSPTTSTHYASIIVRRRRRLNAHQTTRGRTSAHFVRARHGRLRVALGETPVIRHICYLSRTGCFQQSAESRGDKIQHWKTTDQPCGAGKTSGADEKLSRQDCFSPGHVIFSVLYFPSTVLRYQVPASMPPIGRQLCRDL